MDMAEPDEELRQEISRLLVRLHEPDLDAQRNAIALLAGIERKRIVEVLVTLLEADDGQTRGDAAEALMKIEGAKAQKVVAKLLHADDAPLRWHVVGLLFDYGNADGAHELVRVLKEDESADVRYFAACALGRIGDDTALESLEATSREDDGADREGRRVSHAAREAIIEIRSRVGSAK